ncbi:radical SAM/SPASM domain-containing protein [Desulforhopalus singaporensis]|uniref:Radical SAM additional 4Fe4S-binding SPASM domain-containing protein n=1 Tax=Desulforhopalus singaporensis TaxID=91360 RepID=A0A1H0T463_9BACT|nr:radical SAM protein [Desulforhopalus singaporensis]SDP48823.1 radical SAM additional 4Fe4S-binding SPASM domain-containing protein [Desulforhopalus singaporensis]
MSCVGEQFGMEFSLEEIAGCRKAQGLLSMELELSRLCDLRCLYCYAASGKALENELSLDEIRFIIDEAIGLGVKKIIVLGGGEPLLYPHLMDVLEYLRGRNLVVDLFTNGQTLNRELADKLFALGVGVALKMNSRIPGVQDRLAGRKGAHEAIGRALENLQTAGYPDSDHLLAIETIICSQNIAELPGMWRWARQNGIVPYFESITMQGRAVEYRELEVGQEQLKKLFKELACIDREEFKRSWTPHPPLVGSHCARHEYSCTVTSTGEVHPCPGVDVSGGSIRHTSLADIVRTSRIFRDLRNIRDTIKGHCAICELGEVCYGCRGHAYQVTGDYLAEDPICWLKHPPSNS